MQIKLEKKPQNDENLIPLINIVFLILIFFLIATVIRPFSAKHIQLAAGEREEKLHKLTNTVVIDKQGRITVNGKVMASEAINQVLGGDENNSQILNVIADKALPATELLNIISKLEALKFGSVKLVIEKTKQ